MQSKIVLLAVVSDTYAQGELQRLFTCAPKGKSKCVGKENFCKTSERCAIFRSTNKTQANLFAQNANKIKRKRAYFEAQKRLQKEFGVKNTNIAAVFFVSVCVVAARHGDYCESKSLGKTKFVTQRIPA